MTRVNITPLIEHIFGFSQVSSEEELKTLLAAARSSKKLMAMPISDLTKIMEEIMAHKEAQQKATSEAPVEPSGTA